MVPRGRAARPTCRLLGDARARRGKRARLLRQASFPVSEAVDGFDWSNVRFPGRLGPRGDALVRLRRPRGGPRVQRPHGTGQDARGDGAGDRGDPARHPRALLPDGLAHAEARQGEARGRPRRAPADVGRASLVILDEFGYVPLDAGGARLPCQAISDSCERGASCSRRTSSSAAGAPCLPTTGSRRRSSTASSTTEGSLSSTGPATGSRSRSCSASQGANGAPVTKPEEVSWPNSKETHAHFRKEDLTKHSRRGVPGVRRALRCLRCEGAHLATPRRLAVQDGRPLPRTPGRLPRARTQDRPLALGGAAELAPRRAVRCAGPRDGDVRHDRQRHIATGPRVRLEDMGDARQARVRGEGPRGLLRRDGSRGRRYGARPRPIATYP